MPTIETLILRRSYPVPVTFADLRAAGHARATSTPYAPTGEEMSEAENPVPAPVPTGAAKPMPAAVPMSIWMHIPDTVIALCGEESTIPYRRTQWGRVLQSRTGAPLEAYPFAWETHLGRFRPRRSEPLRAPPADRGGGGGRAVGEREPGGQRMPPLKATGRAAYGHPSDS